MKQLAALTASLRVSVVEISATSRLASRWAGLGRADRTFRSSNPELLVITLLECERRRHRKLMMIWP